SMRGHLVEAVGCAMSDHDPGGGGGLVINVIVADAVADDNAATAQLVDTLGSKDGPPDDDSVRIRCFAQPGLLVGQLIPIDQQSPGRGNDLLFHLNGWITVRKNDHFESRHRRAYLTPLTILGSGSPRTAFPARVAAVSRNFLTAAG